VALAPLDRFWNKVDIAGDDDCWLWTAGTDKCGYGIFMFDRRKVNSHRMAWYLSKGFGEFPTLQVLHTCDMPACCNPGHLYLGTHADNMRDKRDRKRGRTTASVGLANGNAKLSDQQVIEIRNSRKARKMLAAEYGVHQTTIDRIIKGERRGEFGSTG
jgi:hypothetical protein